MLTRYTCCMDRTRAKYGVRNGQPVLIAKKRFRRIRGGRPSWIAQLLAAFGIHSDRPAMPHMWRRKV